MKRIKTIQFYIIPVILLMFTSCEDLLLEQPKTVAVENFYNTAEEVEMHIQTGDTVEEVVPNTMISPD